MADTTSSLIHSNVSTTTVTKFDETKLTMNTVDGEDIVLTEIAAITTYEDIFTLLPAVCISVKSNSSYISTGKLFVGQTLYLQYKPKKINAEEYTKTKYIAAKLVILSITLQTALSNDQTTYVLRCTYDAPNILSTVYAYPPKSINPVQITAAETSVNAIKAQLSAGGLNSENKVGLSNDSMIWINTRNKIYECVNKFLAHSWIDSSDAMLVFTRLTSDTLFPKDTSDSEKVEKAFESIAQITSVSTLAHQTPDITFVSRKNTSSKENCFRFDKITVNNQAGITTLKDAYQNIGYVYTPMSTIDTSMADITEFTLADNTLDGATFNNSIRKVEYSDETLLAGKSDKLDKLFEGTNNIVDCGMHFYDDTHAHYDVAPIHNAQVISSFFTNSITLEFDINDQDLNVLLSNALPKAGQKAYLDASTDANIENVNLTGEYVIAKVSLNIVRDYKVICVVTLMSNGTYPPANIEDK